VSGVSKTAIKPVQWRTWPWIAAFITFLFILALIPRTLQTVLAWDIKSARWLNGLLGHNRMFDLSIAGLNSKSGDKVIVICFGLFFLAHSFRQPKSSLVFRRLSFWIYACAILILVYQFQRLIEGSFGRDSPGKELDHWINLKKLYKVPAKVSNSNSFPSGHATAYYFFAFLTLRRYRVMGYCMLLIAIFLTTSRVATGAHWLSDIVLGSIPIAALIAAVATETSLSKGQKIIEKALKDIWFVATTHHQRSIWIRSRSAWREFLAPASLLRKEAQKGERSSTELEKSRLRENEP
jgi:Kdo2-lipid A phosphotransferase